VTFTASNITVDSPPPPPPPATTVAFNLQLLGTQISTDGNYSEDSTIRISAVDGSDCSLLPAWTGTVNLGEQGTAIYTQNWGVGVSGLPSSITITSDGYTTFVAKSRAGPRVVGPGGAKPDDAKVVTTNYPVCGGAPLAVPQWIISQNAPGDPGNIDPLAVEPVYDWFQSMTADLFNAAGGDLRTVLRSIASYGLDPTLPSAGTTYKAWGQSQSPVSFNAFFNQMWANIDGDAICGQARVNFLTNTFYHEGRHAYQAAITNSPAGNDEDRDWLLNNIPIAPNSIFVDSVNPRTVCDASASPGTLWPGWIFNGPGSFDPFDAPTPGQHGPGHVSWAVEMDAYTFAAAHPH